MVNAEQQPSVVPAESLERRFDIAVAPATTAAAMRDRLDRAEHPRLPRNSAARSAAPRPVHFAGPWPARLPPRAALGRPPASCASRTALSRFAAPSSGALEFRARPPRRPAPDCPAPAAHAPRPRLASVRGQRYQPRCLMPASPPRSRARDGIANGNAGQSIVLVLEPGEIERTALLIWRWRHQWTSASSRPWVTHLARLQLADRAGVGSSPIGVVGEDQRQLDIALPGTLAKAHPARCHRGDRIGQPPRPAIVERRGGHRMIRPCSSALSTPVAGRSSPRSMPSST